MSYLLEHFRFGLCGWDIAAALLLAAAVLLIFLRWRRLRIEERELKDRLSDVYAGGIED